CAKPRGPARLDEPADKPAGQCERRRADEIVGGNAEARYDTENFRDLRAHAVEVECDRAIDVGDGDRDADYRQHRVNSPARSGTPQPPDETAPDDAADIALEDHPREQPGDAADDQAGEYHVREEMRALGHARETDQRSGRDGARADGLS